MLVVQRPDLKRIVYKFIIKILIIIIFFIMLHATLTTISVYYYHELFYLKHCKNISTAYKFQPDVIWYSFILKIEPFMIMTDSWRMKESYLCRLRLKKIIKLLSKDKNHWSIITTVSNYLYCWLNKWTLYLKIDFASLK